MYQSNHLPVQRLTRINVSRRSIHDFWVRKMIGQGWRLKTVNNETWLQDHKRGSRA